MIKIWLPLAIIFILLGLWPIGLGVLICGICITIYERIQKDKKTQAELEELKRKVESIEKNT